MYRRAPPRRGAALLAPRSRVQKARAAHVPAQARIGARALPCAGATRCGVAQEPRALACALSASRGVLSACVAAFAGMATQDFPASIRLYETVKGLKFKGRYARAAEKLEAAAAAAAQELAADDCLVVAFLRVMHADAIYCQSLAATGAELVEGLQTIKSVLLPPCMSTLMRRKAAGTLLPGTCRAAEVEWRRAAVERNLSGEGISSEDVRVCSETSSLTLGFEAYMHAAGIASDVLTLVVTSGISREVQLSYAAFVGSALELIRAQPRELSSNVEGGLSKGRWCFAPEKILVQTTRRLLDADLRSLLDGEALSLIAEPWGRLERSGAAVMRKLEDEPCKGSIVECLNAAAAEAAVRGLRECTLAGCAAKEVHVSQFGKCGSCKQAFYCCREHQLADWPAHKAACKAARKAAASSK